MLNEQTTEPPLDSLGAVATLAEVTARSTRRAALRRGEPQPLRRRRAPARAQLGSRSGRARARGSLLRVAKARALGRPRLRAPRRRQGDRRAGARLILAPEARSAGLTPEEIVGEAVEQTPSRSDDEAWLALLLGAATYVVAWLFGAKAWLLSGRDRARARPARRPRLGEARRRPDPAQPPCRQGCAARGRGRLGPPRRQTGGAAAASLVVTERIARFGEKVTTLAPPGAATAAPTCSSACRAGATSSRGARDHRRPVRARPRGGRPRRAGIAARLSAPRAARPPLLRERRARAGRPPVAAAPPSGFDLHSVREYEQGESLRKVHWKTTARRGQLMVKELEDAPRDEIAVILDADAAAVVADSFDVQVRAAGSILRTHAAHARRAVLAVNSAARPSVRVTSLDGDWLAALGVLAEAQPDGTRPVVELLSREGGPSRAVETVVVTARLSGALATACPARARGRASASSGSTAPASRPGRRRSSPSSCGCRRPASPSRSSAAATRSLLSSARRRTEERAWLGRPRSPACRRS